MPNSDMLSLGAGKYASEFFSIEHTFTLYDIEDLDAIDTMKDNILISNNWSCFVDTCNDKIVRYIYKISPTFQLTFKQVQYEFNYFYTHYISSLYENTNK